MLMWVLQVVCRLVAPLVLFLRSGADGEGDAGVAPGDGEAGVCRR